MAAKLMKVQKNITTQKTPRKNKPRNCVDAENALFTHANHAKSFKDCVVRG